MFAHFRRKTFLSPAFFQIIRKKSTTQRPKSYFPYGLADFKTIRQENFFFVDKTQFIPEIEEESRQLFLVRPPRFGKSLFLKTLASYYDIAEEKNFQELFGDLWIGKKENWTPRKNQFYVLEFDLSIDVMFDTSEKIQQTLHVKLNNQMRKFCTKYNFPIKKIIDEQDANSSFERLVYEVARRNGCLWIFIDEYDRFANKLMFEAPDKYEDIVAGVSGVRASSYIRAFFENLKACATRGAKDYRVFTTGISPIALADASGYNIADDLTLTRFFGDLFGFTENDLRRALQEIKVVDTEQNKVIETMKHYYNGYSFPGSTSPLYNPTLSLFFLKKYHQDDEFRKLVLDRKLALQDVVDKNVKISENVFKLLCKAPVTNGLIQELSNEQLPVHQTIVPEFKLRQIKEKVATLTQVAQQRDLVASFMYYHGIITAQFDESGTSIELQIPNEIGRSLFLAELQNILHLQEGDVLAFINKPNEQNLKRLLNAILEKQQTIFDNSFSEGALQGTIEAALRAQNEYKVAFEILKAEEEFVNHENPKYPYRSDLILETKNTVIIIELKRVRPNAIDEQEYWYIDPYNQLKQKLKNYDDTSLQGVLLLESQRKYYKNCESVQQLVEVTENQVKKYAQLKATKLKNTSNEKKIYSFIVVQVGWPLIVKEVK